MNSSIQKISLMTMFLASAAFLSGCGHDDDHHHPDHENELITTLRMNLTHQTDASKNVSITFKDIDGPGALNGVITPDTMRLLPNTQYRCSLELLNESNPSDVEDIGEEIKEESTAHQFFYTPSQGLQLSVSNLDHDTNHKPLGMEADVITTGESRGSLRISLSHYDATPKDGVTPSGETDIEVNFPVSIK